MEAIVSAAEMRACLERLDSFIGEIRALMDFIADDEVLFGREREQARGMLRDLKERLKVEYRRTSTVRGRERMNDVERAYYAPAVHQAYVHLEVRSSSVPGSTWMHDLYESRFDLDYMASQLREQVVNRNED